MATEEQHAAAVIAALNAAGANAYDLDDLAKLGEALPAYYTEVTVSRRFGGVLRMPARNGSTGWRVTVRAVAKTVSNAREMRRRQQAALEYARLTIGDAATTPIQFETAEPIGEDETWYSGLATYTYALKEA